MPIAKFIDRWSKAEAAERANYQLFLSELCDILDVPRPDPATDDTAHNAYVFERAVTFHHRGSDKTTTGRIDLYKRSCFVLEAKQYATAKTDAAVLDLALDDSSPKSPKIARGTAAWDRAMLEALGQAERYARSLPDDEDSPPFLLVVDVGHVIELYADFTQKGKNYLPFPDARSHRIRLSDLANPELRERLRLTWTTPLALDPSKKAAAVTREVAAYLAELAKSFEKKHEPKLVAEFLSRCLFCMFAEDVELLPKEGFRQLLDSLKGDSGAFVPMMELLFEDMNQGRYSGLLKKKLLYFNGGLFASAKALPVNAAQLTLLRKAAALEWRHVEPAIFGTLLERALSPDERHKLGAHYTPRAYVERLVLPTVIEPLREEWTAVRTAAVTLASRGIKEDPKKARESLAQAQQEVRRFHGQLCSVRVLDPACGSGNFLYVALELMKRLEGEVIALLHDLGDDTDFLALQGATVDPHQFLGLELNPRAASIAELVLWIGYLQWHFRVHGSTLPSEPVLRKFNNIENRDAVLGYEGGPTPVKNPDGSFVTRWDGKTLKTDSVTGRQIPDDAAVNVYLKYDKPCPATWPETDFVVGNPPFLGTRRMRLIMGDGYVDALVSAYPDVAENADFVMYWWHNAAKLLAEGRIKRFGFITTNSIRQSFNQRVVSPFVGGKGPLSIVFAVPDHPWVDATEGAAVRIAMTVAISGKRDGQLAKVIEEKSRSDGSTEVKLAITMGALSSDLAIGASATEAQPLQANSEVGYWGAKFYGDGFIVTPEQARELGELPGKNSLARPFVSGRDLTGQPRKLLALDCDGLDEDTLRKKHPKAYQHLLVTVKPVRDHNPRAFKRERWWIFGENQPGMRRAIRDLNRSIFTTETAKHRVFQFFDAPTIAEGTVCVIAIKDAFHLGVLSSRIHVVYSLAAGGTLEDRPRYNKTRCFDPFPFPDCTEKQKTRIRQIAEDLDAHRKRAQATHHLGLTDIYNVLEKVRAGTALTGQEKTIHDGALVSILKQQHDDLDATVADAYGWPWPLNDTEILGKVVALNAARAAEETKGHIRWLRPDYQQPLFAGEKQSSLGLLDDDTPAKPAKSKTKISKSKFVWPKSIAERAKAVEAALTAAENPVTATDLAKHFSRAKDKEVAEILETLAALGRAHPGDAKGTYVR